MAFVHTQYSYLTPEELAQVIENKADATDLERTAGHWVSDLLDYIATLEADQDDLLVALDKAL